MYEIHASESRDNMEPHPVYLARGEFRDIAMRGLLGVSVYVECNNLKEEAKKLIGRQKTAIIPSGVVSRLVVPYSTGYV